MVGDRSLGFVRSENPHHWCPSFLLCSDREVPRGQTTPSVSGTEVLEYQTAFSVLGVGIYGIRLPPSCRERTLSRGSLSTPSVRSLSVSLDVINRPTLGFVSWSSFQDGQSSQGTQLPTSVPRNTTSEGVPGPPHTVHPDPPHQSTLKE